MTPNFERMYRALDSAVAEALGEVLTEPIRTAANP
jgi:hypothetical protein